VELLAWVSDTMGFLGRTAWPVVDLLIRVQIAKQTILPGLLLAADRNTALTLAIQEYPVPWLEPRTEALLGVVLQLAGGFSLLLGLGARVGGLAVLALGIVTQVYYLRLDANLFLVMFGMGYALRGPGPLSFDHLLVQGVARSPLPIVAPIARAFETTRESCSVAFLLGLRAWLLLALLVAGGLIPTRLGDEAGPLSVWLPSASAAATFGGSVGFLAFPLGFGLATRLVAGAALCAAGYSEMMVPSATLLTSWMLTLALLFVLGPGRISLDAAMSNLFKRRIPQLDGKPTFSLDGLPQVVIIGAGFGGIACARALRRTPVKVTVIDRHNYHLFQPLLYQVATAALSPGDIAVPIRSILRDQFNAQVLLGNVMDIDVSRRHVVMKGRSVPYDYLVVATGATHGYFGKDVWAPFAPGLKRVDDATLIRSRLLETFERAEVAASKPERLLNFVIVGGGPTGVELAGAIAELARFGMEKDFRNFDPMSARILLVQAGPRLLPTFPEMLSSRAQQSLEQLGVEVLVNSRVEEIDADGVIVNGKRVASKSVLWAAGVTASPAARWLKAEADGAGRVKVTDTLAVPNLSNVFVIGDAAASSGWGGKPVPGLAPAAKQGGIYIARLITARVLGMPAPKPFTYRHRGSPATIGRKAAVADFGVIKVSGALAWWLWGLVHLLFLIGGRNRLAVVLNWSWSYFSFRPSTRLITGSSSETETISEGGASEAFNGQHVGLSPAVGH
jgi:NADH:ubiquinone reductase (H+-translocating)